MHPTRNALFRYSHRVRTSTLSRQTHPHQPGEHFHMHLANTSTSTRPDGSAPPIPAADSRRVQQLTDALRWRIHRGDPERGAASLSLPPRSRPRGSPGLRRASTPNPRRLLRATTAHIFQWNDETRDGFTFKNNSFPIVGFRKTAERLLPS